MDPRLRGDDSGVYRAPCPCPIQFLNSQRSAVPILCGAGDAVFQTARPESTEGARDAKGPGRTQVYAECANSKCSDPRASTPRDIEACRSPSVRLRPLRGYGEISRKSAQSQGVPRAVFEGLLRIAPGGLTFQATPLLLSNWKAAYPPLWAQVGPANL
jgi:hypothetical protein